MGFSLVSNGVLEPRIAYWLRWVGLKHEEVSFHHRIKAFQRVAQIHRLVVFVALQVVVQRDFDRHGVVLDFQGFPVILADADVVNGQQARQLSSFSSGRLPSTLSCAMVSAERGLRPPARRRSGRWKRRVSELVRSLIFLFITGRRSRLYRVFNGHCLDYIVGAEVIECTCFFHNLAVALGDCPYDPW